jgi:hypothetical protein
VKEELSRCGLNLQRSSLEPYEGVLKYGEGSKSKVGMEMNLINSFFINIIFIRYYLFIYLGWGLGVGALVVTGFFFF